MSNERRAHHRQEIVQEVMVSQGLHFRLCNIRDISIEGAFLELGWGVLTRSVPVEVALSLPGNASAKVYRLSAEVARVGTNGTGIRFRPLDDDTLRELSSFLDHDQH